MVKSCCDSYHTQFSAFPDMLSYHEKIRTDSRWERTEVKNLEVAALDKASPLFTTRPVSIPLSPVMQSRTRQRI